MLFQGSATYPEHGLFQQLVARGGGASNAYTSSEETNYYFQVSTVNLKEALRVFSHFFIDPSLDLEMVDKEVNAVNSEFEIGVSGDERKISNLFKLLSRNTHPLRKFTTGNKDTLKKEGGTFSWEKKILIL